MPSEGHLCNRELTCPLRKPWKNKGILAVHAAAQTHPLLFGVTKIETLLVFTDRNTYHADFSLKFLVSFSLLRVLTMLPMLNFD